MKPPFNLLVIPGDGSCVLRFSLPRWLAYGALGLWTVGLAAMIGFSGDYAFLRRQSAQMEALLQRADDQRALLDSFQTHVPTIRREIMGWKALHAKMWQSFGRERISSATPEAQAPGDGVQLPPLEELELLATGVADEGPRLRKLERVVSHTGKMLSRLPVHWPVRGRVNSGYGLRRSPWSGARERHDGIDIGSPTGTPVKSPAVGTVVAASSHSRLGKHVTLDHGNGVRSRYGHLKSVEVKAGEKVEKGQVIGLVGSTGRSTGPHLHYELLVEGKRVDPRTFLWDRAITSAPGTPP